METTFRHHYPLVGRFQICDQLFGVNIDNAGANRYLDQEIFAPSSGAVTALSRLAGLRPITRLESEVDQRIHGRIGLQKDTASVPAVAAVGPAFLDILFTPKTETAISAFSSLDLDFCFVNKFHKPNPGRLLVRSAQTKKPRRLTGLFGNW